MDSLTLNVHQVINQYLMLEILMNFMKNKKKENIKHGMEWRVVIISKMRNNLL